MYTTIVSTTDSRKTLKNEAQQSTHMDMHIHRRKCISICTVTPSHHVHKLFVVDGARLVLKVERPQKLTNLLATHVTEEGPSTICALCGVVLHGRERADEFTHLEHAVAVGVERLKRLKQRLRVENLLFRLMQSLASGR